MADPNYAQISLELFSDDALLRFVLVHAKGERNSRIVDERDVGRDGRNERNAPHRQEQFGPDFHRPPRKGWASPRDIRAAGILHRITTLGRPVKVRPTPGQVIGHSEVPSLWLLHHLL